MSYFPRLNLIKEIIVIIVDFKTQSGGYLKQVFCSENRLAVQRVKDLLDFHQIPCFVKNEYALGGVGEISPFDAWPEVWIQDEGWYDKASKLIAELEASNQQGSPWMCSHCQEENDASFEICWNCGSEASE